MADPLWSSVRQAHSPFSGEGKRRGLKGCWHGVLRHKKLGWGLLEVCWK